jgi:hypothetical protein
MHNQREIKQNLPVGLHCLTSAFLSQTQSRTKMKGVKKTLTSHELATREEAYSYRDA